MSPKKMYEKDPVVSAAVPGLTIEVRCNTETHTAIVTLNGQDFVCRYLPSTSQNAMESVELEASDSDFSIVQENSNHGYASSSCTAPAPKCHPKVPSPQPKGSVGHQISAARISRAQEAGMNALAYFNGTSSRLLATPHLADLPASRYYIILNCGSTDNLQGFTTTLGALRLRVGNPPRSNSVFHGFPSWREAVEYWQAAGYAGLPPKLD